MLKRIAFIVLALMMIGGLVACNVNTPEETTTASPSAGTSAGESTSAETVLTSVGTPRAETLICDMRNGIDKNAGQFNYYLPNVVDRDDGFGTHLWEPLWDLDDITGEMYPMMAESMAEPLDDTYTKFKVKLREGVYWSDGTEFTSDDVVFTAQMLQNNPDLTKSAAFTTKIKSITATDKYTIQIETIGREPRLESVLGVQAHSANFYPVPKHVYENEDAKSFRNDACIWSGAYLLKDYDKNGNWYLYEKRKDWDRSATGIVCGEPTPQYVLYIAYGTEEKRVMAFINGELDYVNQISLESYITAEAAYPELTGWMDSYPYGEPSIAACGMMFNCAKKPLDDVEVRWALALSFDIASVITTGTSGAYIVSPFSTCVNSIHKEAYYDEDMINWLKDFALTDGYKPFDDGCAESIAAILKTQGIEGLPTEKQDIIDLFGIGWWRYDKGEAEKLLLAEGFTRDGNGKWLLPDGTPWQLTCLVDADPSRQKMVYALAEYWKEFGIDAVVQAVDYATYTANLSQGLYDCGYTWPGQVSVKDVTSDILGWHSDNITPINEVTKAMYYSGANTRWANKRIDEIAEELPKLSSNDPKIVELTKEFLKEVIKDSAYVNTGTNLRIYLFSTRYWTGWPTLENHGGFFSFGYSSTKTQFSKFQPAGSQ